jgi:4,5-dihydroxyphthalate decarboxylase
VRHLKYDVAELAIVTFLQAKAHGKPLVLLPAVVVGALPHPFLVYNADRGRISPADLNGKRVGIRAYSVTTAAWVRGVLQNDHGVDLDSIRWVTFEDPHVAEYSDPPTAVRAPAGKSIVQMLIDGEIDAGVVGGPDLKDSRLQPVIANPNDAAQAWCKKHGALPINHMLVVKESLAKADPAAVKDVFRLVRESKRAMPPAGTALDPLQFGLANIQRSLELIISYSTQQGLIPKQISLDDLFDDTTGNLV